MPCKTNRFFSNVQQHVKMYEGTFVAVEGPNMTHKMNTLPSMTFPFQQVLSARVVLKAGQTNYLLNHLGLGDNATFLAITAMYDDKSKFESDNYVNYSYYSNKNKLFSFAQMLVLTGNSENRIEQLYLHNPNQNAPVILEIMVSIIDEYQNFFSENPDQSDSDIVTFENLRHTDIDLWDEDNSVLVVKNSFNQPILYLDLLDINSITQDIKILTIDGINVGTILLIFISEYDATQARVKITQWIDDVNNNLVHPVVDDYEPIINFTSNVIDDDVVVPPGGNLTSVDGDRSYLGASALQLADYGGIITKSVLNIWIISDVIDYENNNIIVDPSNDLIIKTSTNQDISDITSPGEYYIFFEIEDVMGNRVSYSVNVKIIVE